MPLYVHPSHAQEKHPISATPTPRVSNVSVYLYVYENTWKTKETRRGHSPSAPCQRRQRQGTRRMTHYNAIPTRYNGTLYRSRIEATWAHMFDQLRWPHRRSHHPRRPLVPRKPQPPILRRPLSRRPPRTIQKQPGVRRRRNTLLERRSRRPLYRMQQLDIPEHPRKLALPLLRMPQRRPPPHPHKQHGHRRTHRPHVEESEGGHPMEKVTGYPAWYAHTPTARQRQKDTPGGNAA